MGNAVLIDPTAISRVTLYGVNDTVLDLLDDADVIGTAVLPIFHPIENDNHTSGRHKDVAFPCDICQQACK